MQTERDPRKNAIPDIHGHAKGEHKPYAEERPLPLTARMLFLWFFHACRRGYPRFLMVSDHMNYLTFEDPAAVSLVRRALKLAQAGDLYGAAETASVEVGHAQVVSEGLRRGMRYSIGAEVDNDPRARPDAQNIVDAMRPDGLIRSVHFIPIDHPVHGPNWSWPFDNPEFAAVFEHVGAAKLWETYIAVLVDAIERLPGHIIGHFYVPAVLGQWPDEATLEAYEDRVLDAAEARGMAIEFNTRFLYRDHSDEERRRYLDANRRLLRKAKARGVGIAVGSDAHSPKDQGGAFETVLEVLDELDINELVFPIAGRLARVALRFVKPPEPEPAAPVPTVSETAEPASPSATPSEAAGAVASVRKARSSASPARRKETSSEREAPVPEPPPPAAPPTPPPPALDAEAAPVTGPKRSAPAATAAPSRPARSAAKSAVKAAAPRPAAARTKPSAKPAAKSTVKPAAKAKPARKAAAKSGSAKKAAKKAAPRRPAPKRAAAPKKSPAKKAPARKTAAAKKPARVVTRPTSKKSPSAKVASKKTTAKKPAAKRR